MVIKKSVIRIALNAIFIFLYIVYASSCTKPAPGKFSCEGVMCLNGGYCDSARCTCPVGYEGANCSVSSVAKYIGTWDVRQIIIGSDSMNHVHDTTHFQAFLKISSTPTSFFFDNFNGDANYNQVVCSIDTPVLNIPVLDNTNRFTIETISGYSMHYGNYQLQVGGGSIIFSTADTEINGQYIVRHTNSTVNWEIDTVAFMMKPHHL